ncbi:MAG: hypothetical protein N2047_10415 [Meiothermus sp.]|nr:hypothetical protein [Meiothermus sp.]
MIEAYLQYIETYGPLQPGGDIHRIPVGLLPRLAVRESRRGYLYVPNERRWRRLSHEGLLNRLTKRILCEYLYQQEGWRYLFENAGLLYFARQGLVQPVAYRQYLARHSGRKTFEGRRLLPAPAQLMDWWRTTPTRLALLARTSPEGEAPSPAAAATPAR